MVNRGIDYGGWICIKIFGSPYSKIRIYGPELGSATVLSEEKRELAEFIRNYETWHVEEFPMGSMQNPGENEALVECPWLMGGRKIWILAGSSIAQKS